MDGIAAFNPAPRIETLRFGDGSQCHVVDDALVNPDRLVDFAVARQFEFRATGFNAYPGMSMPTTAAIGPALADFFNLHLRRRFDARRTVHMHCRLSMVTVPPHLLHPHQCICHRDAPVLDPAHSLQACVLYLFRDAGLGGTSFYAPVRSEGETARFLLDAASLRSDEFHAKYQSEPGYPGDSNAWFSRIAVVPAKWNRLIFYDGFALHSGDIAFPARLSADPSSGRLTLNGFFTSRRNAV